MAIVTTHFATIGVPLVLLDFALPVWGGAVIMITFCVAVSLGPVPTLERRQARRRNKYLGVYGESAAGVWVLISFFGLVAYWCRAAGMAGPVPPPTGPFEQLFVQLLFPSSMALFMIAFVKWVGWKEQRQHEVRVAYWAAHPDLEAGEPEPARTGSTSGTAMVMAASGKDSANGGAHTLDSEKATSIAPSTTTNGEGPLPPYSPPPVGAGSQ